MCKWKDIAACKWEDIATLCTSEKVEIVLERAVLYLYRWRATSADCPGCQWMGPATTDIAQARAGADAEMAQLRAQHRDR